jgi:HD-like signal output (HDOD) protein
VVPSIQASALSEASARKQKALGALGDLPPFPAILTRLIASLSGDDISFSKLGDLIEKDVIIAGNLLHLVNSALYARRGEINSVRHALSLLGIDKVRNATLGMSITRMWGKVAMPAGWSMARFNMHSSDMAILSDLLAQRVPVDYPEGAFVAGLLHDIGRMLIARALPAEQERILSMHASGVPYLDCEREVLGWTHADVSAEALGFWKLPDPISTSVWNHHTPDIDKSDSDESSTLPLSRVLAAADDYVNSIGASILPPAPSGPHSAPLKSLGLDDGRLASLITEFQAEHDAMAQLFR